MYFCENLMSDKVTISILGCGWLGFPLATSLIAEGFHVRATTTTPAKLAVFEQTGIDPYLVQFSSHGERPDLKNLFAADILIIAVPPGRRDPAGFENYREMIKQVCSCLPGSRVSRIIYISSTAVYSDNNSIVDDYTDVAPESESGKLIVEAEALLRQQNISLAVLRLSGLIGPGRMPGKFFAGKSEIPGGLAPVNLIHLDDVIAIIRYFVLNPKTAGVYNACAPSHPDRASFYTLAARKEGLPLPQFILEKEKWKIIASHRLKAETGYIFKVPSLMNWLNSLREDR